MGSKRYKYSRYAMYSAIEDFLNDYQPASGKCLVVGDSLEGKGDSRGSVRNTALIDMIPGTSEVVAPSYPTVDIHDLPYSEDTFDYVFADQVLEHVKKPWIAVEEVHRVLKPGGLTILTSCLINGIHGVPDDYYRFTPDGLRVLCERFSVIHQSQGMGDLNMALRCLKGKRGGNIKPGSWGERRAMKNDGVNLIHVWIIATK